MTQDSITLFIVGFLALQVAMVLAVRGPVRRGTVSLSVIGALVFGLLVLALPLWIAPSILQINFDRYSGFMWTWVGLASVAMGLLAARMTGRMPVLELGVAAVIALEVAAAVVLGTPADAGTTGGIAAPAVRSLLAAPVCVGLCGYFGVSLGYLIWGGGVSGAGAKGAGAQKADLHLGYEALVGKRFLLSKSSPVLSTVTVMSVAGVSLGVWLVIVSLAILAGFESDLQTKIIGANAHVVLEYPGGKPFVPREGGLQAVAKTRGVVASSPLIQGEVAAASYSNYTGALLFGVDPSTAPHVLAVLRQLKEGSLEPLVEEMTPAGVKRDAKPDTDPDSDSDTDSEAKQDDNAGEFLPPAPSPGIVIGVEMAKSLNVKVGDRIRVLSPSLTVLTPVGVAPKSLGFRVAAIFSSKMYEYDARFAYVSLPAARRFFELGESTLTGVQLRTDDPETVDTVGAQAALAMGDGIESLDWKRRNQTLFAALKLERVVAFVVLVFIILVASFSIVNTLAMSVVEKRKEIAILKTMGARDAGIMKLFLTQGLLVGMCGTLVGTALAVTTVVLLKRFGFGIPGEVYYIDSLPVSLQATDVVLVVLAAVLIVWDFAVYPALSGARLEPVEGLRDG